MSLGVVPRGALGAHGVEVPSPRRVEGGARDGAGRGHLVGGRHAALAPTVLGALLLGRGVALEDGTRKLRFVLLMDFQIIKDFSENNIYSIGWGPLFFKNKIGPWFSDASQMCNSFV